VSARRPLITATTAGTLLCALWFVPSANATADKAGTTGKEPSSSSQAARTTPQTSGSSRISRSSEEPILADTGSVDTTPYLIGGTSLLGIGAGFVAYSMRVSRSYEL
jgi:hypothetical protein